MSINANVLTRIVWSAIGGDARSVNRITFTGTGELPSFYRVTDFATAAIATAALSITELLERSGHRPDVIVDRRLASFWFGMSIRPEGWKLPQPWDPIAGDYRTADGWIRLHTNAPNHRAAAESVLGAHQDKESVAQKVAHWRKAELEKAIVDAGGCAAEMRTADEWAQHPQGAAVASEPLARIETSDAPRLDWQPSPARPLSGIKVLDMTRVLAGPVATRFLAGYGAQVLRIDPPDWDEPAIVPEVALGKRCARLDLRQSHDRATFERLLSQADVFVHGYRSDALSSLGFDPARRRGLSPGLVDVCLDAYGWTGPWAARRGFDSLVQMSAGIAEAGMRWRSSQKPVPLPVQALDHATGYLMAAATVRGLTRRLFDRSGTQARLSLARTAKLLTDAGAQEHSTPLAPESSADLSSSLEMTDWGPAHRLVPPVTISGAQTTWAYPARSLGSSDARWQ